MNIYPTHCVICGASVKQKPNALSLHITHQHKSISKEHYYQQHIDSRTGCKECGKPLKFRNLITGYADYCGSCAVRVSWRGADDRKENARQVFNLHSNKNGRPKGTKNKQPLSEEGRKNKSNALRGRKCPWNLDEAKINKQKETWKSKTDEEIVTMCSKRDTTMVSNGSLMNGKTYKGTWRPKKPEKYDGDPTKIFYRSLWERQAFRWLDDQEDVVKWSSEEIVIPYRDKSSGRVRRYFPDVWLQLRNGQVYLVEIKPKKETHPPKQPKRQTKRYLTEVMTYAKNISKWDAAKNYCENRGWIFQVWTEDTLKKLGIRILT